MTGRAAIGALTGGSAIAAAAVLGYAVGGRSSTIFGPSVYHGDPARRTIALTFDDGPSESTPQLLKVLSSYSVPATFFQCGANIRRLPSVAREVVSAGHEIGNHGDTHRSLCFQSPSTIHYEFSRAQSTINATLNVSPRHARAPFGARWFGFEVMQKRLNLLGVMWTVIGLDWKYNAAEITRRVIRFAGNGGIICLHDGRELKVRPDIRPTIDAVGRIISVLSEQGYQFETVTQILCPTKSHVAFLR